MSRWHEWTPPDGYRLLAANKRSDSTERGEQHAHVSIDFRDGVWERIMHDLRRLADSGADLGELVNLGVIGEQLLDSFDEEQEAHRELNIASAERIDPAVAARMESYHIIATKLSPDRAYGGKPVRWYGQTIHAAEQHHRAVCGREISAIASEHFEDFTNESLREWTRATPRSRRTYRLQPERINLCVRCSKLVAALPPDWAAAVRVDALREQGERLHHAHERNAAMRTPHDDI